MILNDMVEHISLANKLIRNKSLQWIFIYVTKYTVASKLPYMLHSKYRKVYIKMWEWQENAPITIMITFLLMYTSRLTAAKYLIWFFVLVYRCDFRNVFILSEGFVEWCWRERFHRKIFIFNWERTVFFSNLFWIVQEFSPGRVSL